MARWARLPLRAHWDDGRRRCRRQRGRRLGGRGRGWRGCGLSCGGSGGGGRTWLLSLGIKEIRREVVRENVMNIELGVGSKRFVSRLILFSTLAPAISYSSSLRKSFLNPFSHSNKQA